MSDQESTHPPASQAARTVSSRPCRPRRALPFPGVTGERTRQWCGLGAVLQLCAGVIRRPWSCGTHNGRRITNYYSIAYYGGYWGGVRRICTKVVKGGGYPVYLEVPYLRHLPKEELRSIFQPTRETSRKRKGERGNKRGGKGKRKKEKEREKEGGFASAAFPAFNRACSEQSNASAAQRTNAGLSKPPSGLMCGYP